jgi:hypothetical protein
MEKIGKQKKSRTDRLTQLAQTLVCCAGPDVYFARMKDCSKLTHYRPNMRVTQMLPQNRYSYYRA